MNLERLDKKEEDKNFGNSVMTELIRNCVNVEPEVELHGVIKDSHGNIKKS